MSYRLLMVYALTPLGKGLFTSKQVLLYEAKRSDVISKAYCNCIIPMTCGYHLVCM